MRSSQKAIIQYVAQKKMKDMGYLSDATNLFSSLEIEKCANVVETSLNEKDADILLENFRSIDTWNKTKGMGLVDQWIKRAKIIINKIKL
jgi:hypothetical protein